MCFHSEGGVAGADIIGPGDLKLVQATHENPHEDVCATTQRGRRQSATSNQQGDFIINNFLKICQLFCVMVDFSYSAVAQSVPCWSSGSKH